MPARRLLYLTAHQLVAYHWHGGQLREEASFDAVDAESGFVDYLGEHARSLFTLVVNIADEGFQVDTIPFLSATDRKAVIERKLGQMFPGAAMTVAVSLGYQKDRRKDERVLFMALNNAALFATWLTALQTAEACLAAIYSLPLLALPLLDALAVSKECSLLMTVQDTSIRQSFFNRGNLQFSRLSPLANSSIGGIAQTIAGEAAKTQQYLLSQRLVARNDVLSVHVLAHPQAAAATAAACAGTETLRFQIRSQHELAGRLGLHDLPADSRCDALYLHAAAARPPKAQFAREPQRQQYRLWQVGNGLRMAGSVAFVGCALFAGHQLVDIFELRADAAGALSAADTAEQRYQAIARTFPPLPVGNDVLRQITGRYAEIARFDVSPAGLYGEISRALNESPQIEIDAIEWTVSTPPGSAPPTSGKSAGTPIVSADPSEAATVRGTVQIANNANPREILRIFDGFIGQLQANPRLSVSVEQQPFDAGSEKSLKSDEAGQTVSAARPFSITIKRKIVT